VSQVDRLVFEDVGDPADEVHERAQLLLVVVVDDGGAGAGGGEDLSQLALRCAAGDGRTTVRRRSIVSGSRRTRPAFSSRLSTCAVAADDMPVISASRPGCAGPTSRSATPRWSH